jgi:hypothetical protein
MANTKNTYDPKRALYVSLGAAQFVADKAGELTGTVVGLAKSRRGEVVKFYEGLATRGERLLASIRRSTYTRRAFEQTKVARTQVKAATTSVRKAARSTAKATAQAAKKVS